jgi:predicted component of type VI protein secretion system
VLGKSTWAVLALTCHIELFTQAHYRQSIEHDEDLSDLYKDVFLFHWREESQHAILDELEWRREDVNLSAPERDRAVEDLIALVGAVDGLLQQQAASDVDYFLRNCGRLLNGRESEQLRAVVLKAYRWQYIVSGIQDPRYMGILSDMITPDQATRIGSALAPIMK